jgi:hypothetical protein
MKAVRSLTIGLMACLMSLVAVGSPAPSPAFVHNKKVSPYEARPPVLCLIGTAHCSAQNDPPMKACELGAAKNSASCSTDGVKVIDADSR